MDENELRAMALRQASDDEKHYQTGVSGGMGHFEPGRGPPDTAAVVKRAKAYLAFLRGDKAPKPRR